MHGVKRLFGWMIPALRPPTGSTCRSSACARRTCPRRRSRRSASTSPTWSARNSIRGRCRRCCAIIDRKQIDILHLHGYGATTFGRMAAALRGIPTILHEHANLTDTPWFQKVADRLLEPYTDIALAVSKSTADFVIGARLVPAVESEGRLSRRAARGVQPRPERRTRSRVPGRSSASAADDFAVGTVTRLHESKGNCLPGRRRRARCSRTAAGALFPRRRRAAAGRTCRRRRRALGLGDRFVFAGFRRDVAGDAVGLRSQRVSVALGRHAAHRLRGAGDGEADRRHRCRRPPRHPDAGPRRAHRAEARRRRRWPRKIVLGDRRSRTSGRASARRRA